MPSPLSSPGRTFIIAEAGVNHNGKEDLALCLVDAAHDAGADAVKFQLFDPEELAGTAPLAVYQESGAASWRDQREMLASLVLPREAYRRLAARAQELHMAFIVTPFDIASATFLLSLGLKTLKIPSGEMTNLPFLKAVAALGADIILSTGMSTIEEIQEAVALFRSSSASLTLLHCTSAYPAPYDQVHLRAIPYLRDLFHLPVGLSDHTEGVEVAIAAVACGATVIEKHFTLDRTLSGPDHRASIDPTAFATMVRGIRHVEAALGEPKKVRQSSEENVAQVARRSIVAACDLSQGQRVAETMVVLRRPGTGIAPKFLHEVIGKQLKVHVVKGTPLTWDMLT